MSSLTAMSEGLRARKDWDDDLIEMPENPYPESSFLHADWWLGFNYRAS
jgi:quinol-cytochrome oxidoreductase complex cytochrome b subunit